MSNEQLNRTLDQLHRQLEEADLDEADVQHLRTALRDIVERLGEEGEPVMPSATDVIDEFSVRFAEEHPAMATGLRRLIDLLNQSGL